MSIMGSDDEGEQTEDCLMGGFGLLVEPTGRRRSLWPSHHGHRPN
jgi:hypothetical protein